MTKPHNRITFELSGRKISGFISRCAENDIALYNVCSLQGASFPTVRVTVALSDVKRMIKIAGKCRLHISECGRRGIVLLLRRAMYRYVLVIGAVIGSLILFTASNFVWTIKVEGTFNTDEAHVLSLLDKAGIHRFMLSDRHFLNESMRTAAVDDPDILSMTGTIRGVVLFVKVTEAQKSDIETGKDVSALYARKRGVIEEIYTYSGRAVVKSGDIVHEGDMLITGEISTEEKEVQMSARGKVIANVGYTFTATAPHMIPGKVRTGKSDKRAELEILGLKLHKSLYDECEVEYTDRTENVAFIKVCEVTEYELADGYIQADDEARKEYARQLAEKKLKEELSHDAIIISKQTTYETDTDGNITAVISVVTREDIAG